MATRYGYKCSDCHRGYVEQRDENDAQFVTQCDCGGTFELDNDTALTD